MKKIENLDLGHTRHGPEKRLIVGISDGFDDQSLEKDFPHRHNFYMICLVMKGGGTHIIDFEKIDIIPGRLFFIQPEQVHFWQIKTGSSLAVVQFSADYLTGLFDYTMIPAIHASFESYIDLEPETSASLLQTLHRILVEDARPRINSDRIIQANIFILLAEIERLFRAGMNTRGKGNKSAILEKFKQLLNSKFREISSINEYAGLLNITPNYLNIAVKETTGLTANELLHKRVILEARRLLTSENADIGQTAFDLGFRDASYFARFFKRATGQSPSEFRRDIYKMYQHQDK